MRHFVRHRLVGALIACLSPAAIASESAAVPSGTVTVAYQEFPPYSSTNMQGQAEGFSVDLIQSLAQAAGLDLEFVPATNPAEALRMIEAGRADMSTLLAFTPDRLARGLPTHEIGSFELMAFALSEREFETTDDLAGQRIGAVRGSFSIVGANQIPFSEVIEFEASDDLIVPLLTGEIDAIVSARNVLLRRLRDAGIDNQIEPLPPALVSSPRGFIISPNRSDLQRALNVVIEEELSPIELSLLTNKWFGRPRHFTENPAFWTIACIVAFFAVSLAVMAYHLLAHRAEARRLLKSNAANDLLIQALDQINAAIVIYDKDQRAIHRNAGFSKCFPGAVARVDRGIDMRTLIACDLDDGRIDADSGNASDESVLDDIMSKIERGDDNTRIVPAENGLMYEARDFRVGPCHYASIRVDMTAQHAQQCLIREQAECLQKSNDQLRAFSAMAAHDLRAPLRNMSILVDFAAEDLEAAGLEMPREVREHMDELKSQSSRMSKLVEDLLHYAQESVAASRAQWVNPISVLNDSIDLIDEREGISLILPKEMPRLFVDPTAFEAVMRNLISNAVKHHDRLEGTVQVASSLRAGYVDISVTDDGAGIPELYRETIFEPFRRLTSVANGSGLGLAFVKRAVEEWGGRVSVTSLDPRGSRFTVSIPTPTG